MRGSSYFSPNVLFLVLNYSLIICWIGTSCLITKRCHVMTRKKLHIHINTVEISSKHLSYGNYLICREIRLRWYLMKRLGSLGLTCLPHESLVFIYKRNVLKCSLCCFCFFHMTDLVSDLIVVITYEVSLLYSNVSKNLAH